MLPVTLMLDEKSASWHGEKHEKFLPLPSPHKPIKSTPQVLKSLQTPAPTLTHQPYTENPI